MFLPITLERVFYLSIIFLRIQKQRYVGSVISSDIFTLRFRDFFFVFYDACNFLSASFYLCSAADVGCNVVLQAGWHDAVGVASWQKGPGLTWCVQ